MNQSTKNQVVKKQETGVSNIMNASAWGESEVSSNDIVMPAILLMQGLSEYVTDGVAKIGDFISSLDKKKLGSINEPLTLIPFHMQKIWKISDRVPNGRPDQKFTFKEIVPVTHLNESWKWDDVVTENGIKKEVKRDFIRNFYCIIPGTPIPFVLGLKGTNARAGKALITQMEILKMAGKAPCSTTYQLKGKMDKNDKGTFAVIELEPKSETSQDIIQECFKWYKMILEGKAVADTSEVKGSSSEEDMPF